MCAIAGILSPGSPVAGSSLDRFVDRMAHRGPDGRGTWSDGPIGLAHRRLAILDLTDSGRCPMQYTAPDGRVFVITYNGEIFNFLELKNELAKDGYIFQSGTDTEVVVASYARWGESCLLRFNGMWAFAIWDCGQQTLFLARDRFGIKPLYYLSAHRKFFFASELKAFTALDGFTPSLNHDVAKEALHLSQPLEGSTDVTLMNGVRRLMPGFCMTITPQGDPQPRRWWDTNQHLVKVPGTYSAQVEEWRDLFLDATRLRLRSDVPVASSLSGGLDSSSVVGAISSIGRETAGERLAPSWQQSFISTFPGTANDESSYAQDVVNFTGAKPIFTAFDGARASTQIWETIWAMEDIYPGIAVPVLTNYQAMRQAGVTVSLDGHGADELLGGYDWYLNTPLKDLNARLYDQFHRDLLPSILKNFDRCSMASGIEVRMPFMDWRLVCYTFSLPPETKIGAGYTKRILRDSVKGLIPENVRLRRSKIGFNAPMIEWFNAGLNGLIEFTVSHPRWKSSRLFDSSAIGEELLRKCQQRSFTRADWGRTLTFWTYINLILWEILFLDGENIPDSAIKSRP